MIQRIVFASVASWIIAFSAFGCESMAAEASTPNIVFVLFDDLGWGQPQCYNANSSLRTPNLDRLAAQGMRFTDAHSASAVCTPTRYGILTGRYPFRIGQFGVLGTWSKPIIPKSRATVASILKQRGYDTACIGKWHLGLGWDKANPDDKGAPDVGARFKNGPNELGFDYFCGFTHAANIGTVLEQDRAVAHVTKEENQPLLLSKAVSWIEQRNANKPFFLYFPMCPPHYPVAPSSEYVGKSGGVDLAGKDLSGQANPTLYPDWLFQGDSMLGAIVDALERNGFAQNTLVIVASDNGAEHRAYPPLRESKRSIYEGGHRVPMIARWPERIQAGAVWHYPVCLNDFMATVAEITGASIPAEAAEDSVSMLPALLGATRKPTREAIVHQSMAGDLAIRQGAWKLVFKKSGERELYDLENDISESKDVLASQEQRASQMADLFQSYIRQGRSTPGVAQANDFQVELGGLEKGRKPSRVKN